MEFRRFTYHSKKMKTVVISKTNRQFKVVKSLILDKNVKEIIIATDAGREGELVARLILDKVGNKNQSSVCGLVQLQKPRRI